MATVVNYQNVISGFAVGLCKIVRILATLGSSRNNNHCFVKTKVYVFANQTEAVAGDAHLTQLVAVSVLVDWLLFLLLTKKFTVV